MIMKELRKYSKKCVMLCMLVVMFMVNCFIVPANAASSTSGTVYYWVDNQKFYTQTVTPAAYFNIIYKVPTKSGYTFSYWINSTGSRVYQSGEQVWYTGPIVLNAVWRGDKYTVSYDANGGYGAPSSQSAEKGEYIKITSEYPERYGYKFLGWATSSTSSKVNYYSGNIYSDQQSIKLYAVWAKEYTVHYNANGGIGAPDSQTSTYGNAIRISSEEPTRDGYRFKGWTTSLISDTVAYKGGASYGGYETITLYAVWEEIKTYTITYMANGGQYAPNEQIKGHGKSIYLSSSIPTRDGYIFKGWGIVPSSSEVLYSEGSLYTDNASITLYAIWQKKEATTETPIIPTETPTDTPTTIKPTTSPSDKTNKEYGIGDVNNDGTVNLNDAHMTLKAALGIIQLDEYSKKAADVDGKEGVTLLDAQLCLKYALGIVQLPKETEENDEMNTPIPKTSPLEDDAQETEKPIETNTPIPTSELPGSEESHIYGNIYGCGAENTTKVDGMTFRWYDKYEERVGNDVVSERKIKWFKVTSHDIKIGFKYAINFETTWTDEEKGGISMRIFDDNNTFLKQIDINIPEDDSSTRENGYGSYTLCFLSFPDGACDFVIYPIF